jgi:hypothetical protein
VLFHSQLCCICCVHFRPISFIFLVINHLTTNFLICVTNPREDNDDDAGLVQRRPISFIFLVINHLTTNFLICVTNPREDNDDNAGLVQRALIRTFILSSVIIPTMTTTLLLLSNQLHHGMDLSLHFLEVNYSVLIGLLL